MDPATGDGESAADIRASDAERDAALQRLSVATGDGRLTLEEFSQRMDRATTAKTRAELDRLVADLPTGPGAAGSAVAERGPGRPSWHISPIGGLSVSGPWRMERSVIVVSLIGGADLDLSQAQLAAPQVTLTKVSLLGGSRSRSRRGSGSMRRASASSAAPASTPGRSPARARRPSKSARSHCSAGPGSTVQGRPASAKARRRGHRWTGGPGGGLTGTSGGPSGAPNGGRDATVSPAAPARQLVDRAARNA